ncbi:S8 family peptidase [Salinithrix halophila]|uniref:S8 family serine peptidase n=1 Tax=Salinithrix halophila TaxID=1485204 RepID=A0ABV8JEP4_9BACL
MNKGLGILLTVVLLFTAACTGQGDEGRDPPQPEKGNGKQAVDKEWVVKWKGREPDQAFLDTVQILHETGEEPDGVTMLVRLKPGVEEERWMDRWSAHEDVEYLHPNQKYKVENRETTVPGFQAEGKYYLNRIDADKAWQSIGPGSSEKPVTVAVVDTGVDLKHPFLQAWLAGGINLKDPSQPPQDTMGHGTHVAGVIAEVWEGFRKKWGQSYRSLKIMPVKVMQDGSDGDVYYTSEGIRKAVRKGADVVVLSQGSWTYSETMADAVALAEKKGVVVVGAAGNAQLDKAGEIRYNRPLYYPAAFPTVLGVGSLGTDGKVVPTSNGGPGIDVTAPGEEIWAAMPGGDFASDSGTSFAAPQVGALAALIRQQRPDLSAGDVRNLIRQTAVPVGEGRWNELAGFGRIDVYEALTQPLKKDIYEPNDSPAEAIPFSSDQSLTAVLEKGNRDCFRMETPYTGTLSLDLKAKSRKNLRLVIRRKGERRKEIYRGEELKNIRMSVPPGNVTFCLSSDKQEKAVYSLENHFRPAPDDYENNDHQWNAHNLELNAGFSYVKGTLHKQGDEDWFRLKIPEPGELKVRVDVQTPRHDPVLYIQKKGSREGRKLDGKAEGKAEERTLKVSPGNLYVRVSDYGNNVIPTPYNLFFDYKPRSQDDFEPNDISAEAALLADGETVKGRLAGPSDMDWYSFFLKEGEQPQLQLKESKAAGSMEIILYDEKRRALVRKTGNEKGGARMEPNLTPGTYFIRVYGGGKGAGQYELRFSKKRG